MGRRSPNYPARQPSTMAFSLAKSARLITRARPAAFNLVRTYAEAAPTLNLTFGTPRQAFFDNVTVNNDSSCQILAEEAAPIENFDLASAKSALDSANAAMSSAGSEEAKAAAQVEVEALQGIIDALA